MTTKALIQAEIDRIGEDNLPELYQLIKHFAETRTLSRKPSLMARLKQIQIDAPADFAANLDYYMSEDQRGT